MKALVLAGGSGTRLRPITNSAAKQLIPVANKPILFYVLENIRDAGITDVGVVVGDTAAEIQAAVSDGSAFGLDITYVRQDAPLGLAHAVHVARDFLSDEDFVMYLGDNFLLGGIASLVDEFRAGSAEAQILLTPVRNPECFGVAELGPDRRVVRLVEKPERPNTDLAVVGVYLFSSAIHEAVSRVKPSWRGELEITDAVQWLIDNGHRVGSTKVSDYWKDTGNVEDMLEVNRSVLETVEPHCLGEVDAGSELVGRVRIGAGTRITRSRIVGPVVVGSGAVVTDSYIGPFTSVADGCVITDSEVEYSIVLGGASLIGIRRLAASLIGRDAEVAPAPRMPQAHRLVLGDYSRVQISGP